MVELLLGATGGAGLVTIPIASVTKDTPPMLQSQGFTHPIAAVRVRNVGRLRVRITAWSLTTTKGGISLSPISLSIGPPLPHWLEAGDTELWAADLAAVHALMHTTASVLKIPLERMGVRATVDLGSGRTVKARGTIR